MEIKEIKEQILVGARDLYMRYGIKSVTMDELATHLSISKKTIYQHFPDKDSLVVEAFMKALGEDFCKWEEIQIHSADTIEEMKKGSELIRAMFEKINPAVLYDIRKYYPEAWHKYQEYKRDFFFNQIKNTIEKGKKEGYFREDVNSDIMAVLRLQQIDMTFDPKIFPENTHSLMELNMQFFNHFIYGIATLKGHKRMNELLNIND